MGPRDPSGGARLAEFLAALHRIALMHGKLGEVHVDGGQSLAVVEDDAVPFEEQITREDDDTGVGGQNRSTRSGAEIDAVVLAEELAIEHSAHAKSFGNDRIKGLLEGPRPQRMRAGFVIGGSLGGLFLIDALQRFRVGTCKAALDGERLGSGDDFALLDGDADFLREMYGQSGGRFSIEL